MPFEHPISGGSCLAPAPVAPWVLKVRLRVKCTVCDAVVDCQCLP